MTEPAGHQGHVHGKADTGHHHSGAALVTDPVCGMQVDPAKATEKSAFSGQTYFFCSAGCRSISS